MLERTEEASTGDSSELSPKTKTRREKKLRPLTACSKVTPNSKMVRTESTIADPTDFAQASQPTSQPASSHIVLPDECESEWTQLVKDWQDAYKPQNALTRILTMNAAVADWILKRYIRRYHQAEQALYSAAPDPSLWNPKQTANLDRILRLRSASERSFYQARNVVEQIRSRESGLRESGQNPKGTRLATKIPGLAGLQDAESNPEPAKPRAPGAIIQCVTVQVIDSKTFTLFQPRNEYFQRMIESAREPKPTVKRALYFLHGIPAEYRWISDSDSYDGTSHFTIERSCQETLADLASEQAARSMHVLPVGDRHQLS